MVKKHDFYHVSLFLQKYVSLIYRKIQEYSYF